jgi:cytochrome c-type biogenesis protein CcmE
MSFRTWSNFVALVVALALVCACKEEDSQESAALGGLGPPLALYKMVDDLLKDADLSRYKDKELKIHGWVAPGSIREAVLDQQTQRTFVLQKSGKKIRVFSSGPKPDTFKDQAEIVASGRLAPAAAKGELAKALGIAPDADGDYVLVAEQLDAKCPSKYDGAGAAKDMTKKFQ